MSKQRRGSFTKIHPGVGGNVSPHSKHAAEIDNSSESNLVQALRHLGDIRARKLTALSEEDYDMAAELKDAEDRIFRAISQFNKGPASESEFSPLATILRECNDSLVLATCASSDELLESLGNCKDENSIDQILKMVGHEQFACVQSWNRVMRKFRTEVVDTKLFSGIIFFFIFVATAAVGMQTHYQGPHHLFLAGQHPELKQRGETIMMILDRLDIVVMIVFLLEAVMKIVAEGSAPFRYFADSWNIFDMVIVAVGFLPFDTGQIMALRLLRLLRVFKMVRALPALQVIMSGMLGACKQLVFVGGLMVLTFYLFAVFGFILFAENDPEFFGDLESSMITLWQITTGDDWTEVMYTNMFGCNSSLNSPHYADRPELCIRPTNLLPWETSSDNYGQYALTLIFFMLFFLVAAILMINLVVGVIMISMMEAKAEQMNENVQFKLNTFRIQKNKKGNKIPPGKYLCTAQVNLPEGKTFSTKSMEAKPTHVRWNSTATFSLLNKHNLPNKTILFQVCRKTGCLGSVPLWQLHLDFDKMEENVPYRLDLALKPCAPPGLQPPGTFILRVCVKKKTKADSVGEDVAQLEMFQENFNKFESKVKMLHRMSKNYRGPIRRTVRLSTLSASAIAPDPSIFIVDNPNESNEEKAEGDLASDLYRPFAYTQDLIDTSDLPAHNTAPEHMVAPAPEHVVAPAPEHMIAPAPEHMVAPAPEHMIAPAPEELPSKKRLPDAEVAEGSPASRAQPKPVDDSSQSDAEAGASKFPTASIQGNKAPTTSEETQKGPDGVTSLRLGRLDEIVDINSVDSNDSIDSVKTVTLGESPNL